MMFRDASSGARHGSAFRTPFARAGRQWEPRVKPHSGRLDLSIYPHKVEIPTRFADLDSQKHLNNVRILELYQEARISFNLALWEGSKLDPRSHRVLVVRQSIDYVAEVKWPGAISIGVGVSHTGNTSYTLGLAMFQNGMCVGLSDAVLVYATEHGSAPIPDRMREVLAANVLPLQVPASA
jgi:acyl-CoA thioester hydrolase